MTDESKKPETDPAEKPTKVRKLELNKETVEDLAEGEAEQAKGGMEQAAVRQSRKVCIA